MRKRKTYGGSTSSEREFREKLQSLLPAVKVEWNETPPAKGFAIQLASKYTESEEKFNEKEKQHPADYFIYFNGIKIAVIEVTRGKPGYTVRKSRFIKISENKLEPLEREKIQGYVVMVVIAEDTDSKERFIWSTPAIIRRCYRGEKKEYVGKMWKQKLWVYRVPVNKWKIGLESFVDEVIKIQKRSSTIQTTLT